MTDLETRILDTYREDVLTYVAAHSAEWVDAECVEEAKYFGHLSDYYDEVASGQVEDAFEELHIGPSYRDMLVDELVAKVRESY